MITFSSTTPSMSTMASVSENEILTRSFKISKNLYLFLN